MPAVALNCDGAAPEITTVWPLVKLCAAANVATAVVDGKVMMLAVPVPVTLLALPVQL